jgi:tetratricopeptide (TPR) repeat protein
MNLILTTLRKPTILYSVYVAAIVLLAALFFGNLGDHLLDDHDAENFRDNAKINDDFLFLFSPDKEQAAGRLPSEFAKWLIWLVAGESPRAFHLANVAAHAAVVLILPLAYRATGLSFPTGALASLLFLINVGQFNAIHRITQLDYLLAMLFALAAIVLYGAFLSCRRPLWLWLGVLVALLAISTHGAFLILFPFALYWTFRTRPNWRLIAKLLGPIALASAGLAVCLLFITVRDAPVWDLVRSLDSFGGLISNLGMAVRHLGLFLSRLLTTAHWLFVPIHTSHPWEPYAGLAVGVLGAYILYKRMRPLDIWVVWALLALLPFTPISDQGLFQSPTGFSRYLYFATAGSSLLLAHLLNQTAQLLSKYFHRSQTIYVSILSVPLAFTSYIGLQQVEALSIYSSARYYIAGGEMEVGLERLHAALAGNTAATPLPEVYFHLASMQLYFNEDPDPALRQALALFPDYLWVNLVKSLVDQENNNTLIQQRGQDHLAACIEQAKREGRENLLVKNLASLLHNMGKGYFLQQDYPRAVRTFERVLEINPDKHNTRKALGATYAELGFQYFEQNRHDLAIEAYQQTLDLNPDDRLARISLGWLFYFQGRWQEAIDQYRLALKHEVDADVQFALGLAYLANRDDKAAQTTYAQGIRLFGVEEAQRIGVLQNLDALIKNSEENIVAREIRMAYWP